MTEVVHIFCQMISVVFYLIAMLFCFGLGFGLGLGGDTDQDRKNAFVFIVSIAGFVLSATGLQILVMI